MQQAITTADLKEKYPEYFQYEKIPEALQQKLVDLPVMKRCSKCGVEKLVTKDFFHKRASLKMVGIITVKYVVIQNTRLLIMCRFLLLV